ncbi:lysine-specific demethylase 8-like [Orbicella faveolata]|uniref:lysine-specific demethylase 8-like n=1 Tax=Orbicella faveolata TaxID=48498 RepID=UPI0009E2066D|nr:lysine-specific demethylase 8-like [Orbicella faveolata]
MALRCLLLSFILSSVLIVSVNSSDNLHVPVGHLRPLGSHRPPETNLVDDLQEMPSPQEFWTKYVRPSKAVVLRGAAKYGRAFTQWTDEYLKEKFADLEVRLEAKKEKSSKVPIGAKGVGRDTIGNFISHYHEENNNLYVVSELPTPMWPDVTVIPPLTCGLLKDRLVEVDLWMSGGGTKSILHKDAYNAINCLYNGTKEWKMIEYKYEDKIYKAWEPPQMVGGFSRINVLKVDLLKYPKVAEVPWSFVTVNAGDCLFLPKSKSVGLYSYVEGVKENALLMFDWLGGNEKGFITKDDVRNLSRDKMRALVLEFEGTDVSNTEEAEYGVIDVSQVRDVLNELLAVDGHVVKDKFINAYVEVIQGTKATAEIIFDKLRDETNTSDQVTKKEVQRNLRRAIQRFIDWAKEPDIPPGMDSPEPNDAYMDDNDDELEVTRETIQEEGRHQEL